MPLAPLNNCTISAIFASYRPLEYALHAQLLLCTTALAILCFILFRSRRRNMIYHKNLRVLVVITAFFFVLQPFFNTIRTLYYEVQNHRVMAPCNYMMVSWMCLALEIPIYLSSIGFTLCHVLISIERCIATAYVHKYEHMGYDYIAPPIAVALGVFVGWTYYLFYEEDLYTYRSHCMLSTPTNFTKFGDSLYVILSLDLCSAICDVALFVINKAAKKRKNDDYTLNKSYQLYENDVTLQIITPLSAVHSVGYIMSQGISLLVRIFFGNVELVLYVAVLEWVFVVLCAYACVPLIAFYVLVRRFEASCSVLEKPDDETNFYFKQFQQQMDSAFVVRRPGKTKKKPKKLFTSRVDVL